MGRSGTPRGWRLDQTALKVRPSVHYEHDPFYAGQLRVQNVALLCLSETSAYTVSRSRLLPKDRVPSDLWSETDQLRYCQVRLCHNISVPKLRFPGSYIGAMCNLHRICIAAMWDCAPISGFRGRQPDATMANLRGKRQPHRKSSLSPD